MQKKINTEFTRASDEKCTSESVPPDKWQDEHVNNEMSTGTTFYTLLVNLRVMFSVWGLRE